MDLFYLFPKQIKVSKKVLPCHSDTYNTFTSLKEFVSDSKTNSEFLVLTGSPIPSSILFF